MLYHLSNENTSSPESICFNHIILKHLPLHARHVCSTPRSAVLLSTLTLVFKLVISSSCTSKNQGSIDDLISHLIRKVAAVSW